MFCIISPLTSSFIAMNQKENSRIFLSIHINFGYENKHPPAAATLKILSYMDECE